MAVQTMRKVKCDNCGKLSDFESDNFVELREQKRKNDWYPDLWAEKDYCPDCKGIFFKITPS